MNAIVDGIHPTRGHMNAILDGIHAASIRIHGPQSEIYAIVSRIQTIGDT
ncbi:MAG TPA: hypothetical protein VGQ76_06705 [Thermoanaerobaculia bacterium]|nr:hypothetical protein [Thermoanaerobaculia bacterium]